tara:strand:+ start:10328 stop:11173 length:846 start_codon:yes stop_codon:yes gene_type:complete
MFIYSAFFIFTILFFILDCSVKKISVITFNSVSLIKNKLDEPRKKAEKKQKEQELSKDLIDTINSVVLINTNDSITPLQQIDVTNTFKEIFMDIRDPSYNYRLSTSISDFINDERIKSILHDDIDNDVNDERTELNKDNYNIAIEYTYIGDKHKVLFDNWITFPMYIPEIAENGKAERLRPKRKLLSASLGNKTEFSENIDITKILKKYAGPMHTFHSEFGGIFTPKILVDDTELDINHKFTTSNEDTSCDWILPNDQTIKIIDSKAQTYITSLYSEKFEW